MGTRNLTMVIDQEGEVKVAQYGQWDGYPSGVGVGIVSFIKNETLFENFKKNLPRVRFIDDKGRDKDFIDSYNRNAPKYSNEEDNRTPEQKRWFSLFCTRDIADEVLTNIANSNDEEILLMDRRDTATGDNSWVEWSYIINLKEETLSVHSCIDTPAIKVYRFKEIPSPPMFIKEFDESPLENTEQ